jgi:glycosyltransferase involved in cell wall biosynthesis
MATSDAVPSALSPARLRVLIVAPFPPQATGLHGGARALAANLLAIATRHEVAIAYVPDSSASEPDETVAEACALVEALPTPQVHGPRRWLRRLAVDAALIRGVPIWASELRTKEVAARLSALTAAWRPDVIQFEFLPTTVFFEALREFDAPRVLVDHDAGLRPAHDFGHLPSLIRNVLHDLDERAWRHLDDQSATRVDATVVFTERDRLALNRSHPRPTECIPLVLPARKLALDPLGHRPQTILFVGYFGHEPNADAAGWLALEIFPRIRESHRDAQLVLVGGAPPAEVRGLEPQGVATPGAVADVSEYLDEAAVVVAPIRTGGGVRVKVLEALGAGKAVVATSLAAEGIDAPPGEAIVLADSTQDFAAAVAALLDDEERRKSVALAAYTWARDREGRNTTAALFDRLYGELLAARPD